MGACRALPCAHFVLCLSSHRKLVRVTEHASACHGGHAGTVAGGKGRHFRRGATWWLKQAQYHVAGTCHWVGLWTDLHTGNEQRDQPHPTNTPSEIRPSSHRCTSQAPSDFVSSQVGPLGAE